MPTYQMVSVAIEAEQSLSAPIDCTLGLPVMIVMPEAWGGSTDVTFQVSPDGILYHNLVRLDGSEVVCAVIPGTATIIPEDVGQALAWMKLRAGPSSAPMPRDERREFLVVLAKGSADTTEAPARQPAKKTAAKKKAKPRYHR